MGAIEQKYCRTPLARSFNASPRTVWIPNINISFSEKFGSTDAEYESGRPDAFVFSLGKVICIECKAAFVKFDLSKWKRNQIDWHDNNSQKAWVPYYVALWICDSEDREVTRDNNNLYLVPFDAMLTVRESQNTISAEKCGAVFCHYRLPKIVCNGRVGQNYLIRKGLW